jgi:DNA replication and repair protein RecF
MYCRHLSLANFRSYRRLDLDLSPHVTIFWGDNGQGKSNLIEAIYFVATTRSYRTSVERELVNWYADTDPVFARVAADVVRHQSTSRLEMILAAPPRDGSAASAVANDTPTGPGQAPAAAVRRRARINGHNRRPIEMLGHLNVVLFSPEDVELVAGPAEIRRRYLTITLCQVDSRYVRTVGRYDRVLQQRNALLRELRERAAPTAPADQLEYWDDQLVELGSELVVTHLRALSTLNRNLQTVHPRLAHDSEPVQATYRSSVPLEEDPRTLGDRAATPQTPDVLAQVRERFRAHLAVVRPRERQRGVTLLGPHRDDVGFYAGAVDLRVYGSRGQQRTASLGVKLAEVGLVQDYTNERPVLLLDDVMSELDPRRRALLQAVVAEQEQVLLTATDLEPFASEFLGAAAVRHVSGGAVS